MVERTNRRSIALVLAVSLLGLVPAAAADVTFEERVDAQRAIERVYYGHLSGTRRTFDETVPPELLADKVRTYLKQSVALEQIWGAPVTAEVLEQEWHRILTRSRMPERLRELIGALNGDPLLIRECLVRPVLVDRWARERFASDARGQAAPRSEAERLHQDLRASVIDPREPASGRTLVDLVAGSSPPHSLEPLRNIRSRIRDDQARRADLMVDSFRRAT